MKNDKFHRVSSQQTYLLYKTQKYYIHEEMKAKVLHKCKKYEKIYHYI